MKFTNLESTFCPMKQPTIVIAANEEDVLKYQSFFEKGNPQWNLEFYSDCQNLEDALRLNEVAIIMVDGSLAGFSEELISELERAQPVAQKFIAIDEAVRENWNLSIGNVTILLKPMDGAALVETLQQALAIDTWLGQDRVKEIVSNLEEFPSLPHMYLKVMNALNSRNSSIEHIGHLISDDVAITAKVLQVVNSSFFGFEEKISDITHAVSVLGVDQVKSLVLTVQVFGSSDDGKQGIVDSLLRHSISVANAAKRIALYKTNDQKLAGEAYTAGLLHDLGKMILLNSDIEKTIEAWTTASEEGKSAWELEKRLIGASHAEVGAYILGRWGMPISIVEAAAFHHQPQNGMSESEFSSLAAVHIANAVVWGKARSDEDHADSHFDEEFMNLLGVSSDWEFWKDISEGKDPVKKKMGLKRSAEPEGDSAEETAEPVEAAQAPKDEKPELEEAPEVTESIQKKPKVGVFAWMGMAATVAFVGWLVVGNKASVETLSDESDLAWSEEIVDIEEELDETNPIDLAVVEEATESVEFEKTPVVEETPLADKSVEGVLAAAVDAHSIEEVIEESPKKVELVQSPMPRIKKTEETFPVLELAGIFYSESNPAATVNGRIVRVGSQVSGTTVVSITRKYVTLSYKGESTTLKLK